MSNLCHNPVEVFVKFSIVTSLKEREKIIGEIYANPVKFTVLHWVAVFLG